ncbi:hypothetical protein [Roseobacter sp. CCS2]|uniref:hypothetical protein n=1 Tax=Roseobacter sp. CCS2 TaxID=391593 RepID=UPI0012EA3E7F|nr:hypothetical protein [Roseobacter sp. CCS2]
MTAAFFAFVLAREYFNASRYDFTAEAAEFRDECVDIVHDDWADRTGAARYVPFLEHVVSFGLCGCVVDRLQSKDPTRTELYHQNFIAASRPTAEARRAALNVIMNEQELSEDAMSAIVGELSGAIRSCGAQKRG